MGWKKYKRQPLSIFISLLRHKYNEKGKNTNKQQIQYISTDEVYIYPVI